MRIRLSQVGGLDIVDIQDPLNGCSLRAKLWPILDHMDERVEAVC